MADDNAKPQEVSADTKRLNDGFREWFTATFPEFVDHKTIYTMCQASWSAGTVLALDVVLDRITKQIK